MLKCQLHIQTCIDEREKSTQAKKDMDLDPITSFTLDIWYSSRKQLKIGKEIGLLKGKILNQGSLTPHLKNGQKKA